MRAYGVKNDVFGVSIVLAIENVQGKRR